MSSSKDRNRKNPSKEQNKKSKMEVQKSVSKSSSSSSSASSSAGTSYMSVSDTDTDDDDDENDSQQVVPFNGDINSVLNTSVVPSGPYSKDSVVCLERKIDQRIAQELFDGVKKRLVIIHRTLGGNSLCFRNHNFVKIEDPMELYHARIVYFTNDATGGRINGHRIFDDIVTINAKASISNTLEFVYESGRSYYFRDEASFLYWSGNLEKLHIALAKVS